MPGVVVGLLILTPIFTAQLDTEQVNALDASTAILLDSTIPPVEKLDLGGKAGRPDRHPGGPRA